MLDPKIIGPLGPGGFDDKYCPDWPIFLGLDFGWWNNYTGWIQPSPDRERLVILFAHYQECRTNEENAQIALEIHQARGYGPLAGGWGDPSKPEALRAYSQIFGAQIRGASSPVRKGQRIIKEWLQASRLTKGQSGLVFSRYCPPRLIQEFHGYDKHEAGTGPHHGPDGTRYFIIGWTGA